MDNNEFWDIRHKDSIGRYNQVTEFARFCFDNFLERKTGKLLELCCGKGADSLFFHYMGFRVTAIDASKEAMRQFNDMQRAKRVFISSYVRDISGGLPFEDKSFEFVYSRLGLHYFTDQETRDLFAEIERILKSEGLLFLQVKSTSDKDYGLGEQLEADMYRSAGGETRHFFSKEYATSVASHFQVVYMDEKKIPNGNAYLEVVCKKI
jgi:ubiquinone/menaquinone biosynthesis C-methylase UbiE